MLTDASLLSQLLKASADPLRLEILRVLSTDSFGVLELCAIFDIKQSGMSHHLKVMTKAGLLNTRKEGNSIFYRRNNQVAKNSADVESDEDLREFEALATMRQAIFAAANKLQISAGATQNLNVIYEQRARACNDFFSQNASKFKTQQDLIAAFEVYEPHVNDALKNSAMPSRHLALEIGPGTGEFLANLSAMFDEVIALDNNDKMLAKAQEFSEQQGLKNLRFVHDDTRFCQELVGRVDCAVMSMVLHHTPSPASVFADVGRTIKPQGVLIICELCHHGQEWTQSACGDLWLGFDPQDLSLWAGENMFTEGQSSYFALRNGFQIQIRQFIKQ